MKNKKKIMLYKRIYKDILRNETNVLLKHDLIDEKEYNNSNFWKLQR